jgi:hypothetical protein
MDRSNCQARSTGLLDRRSRWDLAPLVPPYVGLFFALLSCMGCGRGHPNLATISGKVKLDGQPVQQGSIQFLPMQGVEGSIANGEIVEGRYRISGKAGPAIGWNRVEISSSRKTGRLVPEPYPKHGTREETVEAVAPRFNSASTLKFEVKPGENTADFEVTSK